MTENELRRLLQSVPAKGEEALFSQYHSYVYAIAFRQLHGIGTQEDVEECVIDVFLEIIERIDDIREGSLKSYIGTTARNQAINRVRSIAGRARKTVSIEETEANGEQLCSPQDVEQDAEQRELTRRVYESILRLGEPDASILIQKFYYGRNAVEIARVLHMRPGTVRNRCARALQKLRTALADLA